MIYLSSCNLTHCLLQVKNVRKGARSNSNKVTFWLFYWGFYTKKEQVINNNKQKAYEKVERL